jgi:hypothetical protein
VNELWESEVAHESWFKADVAPTMPAGEYSAVEEVLANRGPLD